MRKGHGIDMVGWPAVPDSFVVVPDFDCFSTGRNALEKTVPGISPRVTYSASDTVGLSLNFGKGMGTFGAASLSSKESLLSFAP